MQITTNILQFLDEIGKNNNRDWYHANKTKYQKAKKDFEEIVRHLNSEIIRFDSSIPTLEPKEFIFRIFRDVRFSPDKSPYKTNFGAFFSPTGRKGLLAGYYVHIEPGKSFLGGGLYMPPSPELKKVRLAIYESPEEFKRIIHRSSFKNTYGQIEAEKLTNPPRGFDKEFEDIELLKFKWYTALAPLSDKELKDEKFTESAAANLKDLQPLVQFINNAIQA